MEDNRIVRKEINLPIAKRLESLMNDKRISNKDLAKMIGMSEQTVTRIKRGEADITVSLVEILARALGVSRDTLLNTGATPPTYEVSQKGTSKKDYSIFEGLSKVAETYRNITRETFAGCEEGKMICNILPRKIEEVCGIDTTSYLTTGSIGIGQRSDVPWIATFYKPLTTSATKGVYIVLLYKADMSGIYLTLNQGITIFEKLFKGKKGRIEANKMARRLQRTVPKPDGFSKGSIGLMSDGHLGKGYEAACIFQRYYDFSDPLPSNEEFSLHFNELLRAYESVIDNIGKRTADEFIFYELAFADEDTVVDENEDADISTDDLRSVSAAEAEDPLELPEFNSDDIHPEKKADLIITKGGRKIYPRKKSVALAAIAREKDRGCEYCGKVPFISAKTLLPYYECHHLVALSRHGLFNVSLDVPSNVCVLCPEHHRLLHHGIKDAKREVLSKLYDKHKDDLTKSGIDITEDKLLKMYGC